MHDAQNLISWQAPASDDSQVSSGKVSTWSPSACLKVFKSLYPCVYIFYVLFEVFCCMPVSLLSRYNSWAKDLMFLGFRHQDGDFLYGQEWSTFSSWLSIHIAFSRDHEDKKAGKLMEAVTAVLSMAFLLWPSLTNCSGENGWRHRKHAADGSNLIVYFSIAVGFSILLHARRLAQWIWRYLKVYVQDLIEEQGQHVCKLLDAWLKRQPSGESCQSNGKIGNICVTLYNFICNYCRTYGYNISIYCNFWSLSAPSGFLNVNGFGLSGWHELHCHYTVLS